MVDFTTCLVYILYWDASYSGWIYNLQLGTYTFYWDASSAHIMQQNSEREGVRTRSRKKVSARQFSTRQFSADNWGPKKINHADFWMQYNLAHEQFDPNKFIIETNLKLYQQNEYEMLCYSYLLSWYFL